MIRLILFIILMVLIIVTNFHQMIKLTHTLLKKMGCECRFMLTLYFQRKFSLVLTPKIKYCTSYNKFFFISCKILILCINFSSNHRLSPPLFTHMFSVGLLIGILCTLCLSYQEHLFGAISCARFSFYFAPLTPLRSLQLPSHLTKQHLSLPFRYCFYQQAVSSVNRNKSEGRLKQRERQKEREKKGGLGGDARLVG